MSGKPVKTEDKSLRIAICDDEEAQRILLARYVEEWADTRQIPVKTEVFPGSEHFLFIWEEDKTFDLLILDIEMGEMNGMSLALKLREQNWDIPILFVTGYDKYMAQGYEVSALHYLLKPIQKQKMFSVLDRAVQKQPPAQKLMFRTDSGMISLPVPEIWFFEAQGHTCILHTKEAGYSIYIGITELKKQLGAIHAFVPCHRSYIVNLQHVTALEKAELLLDNQTRLPLSRGSAKEVNQAFIKYYLR